MRHVISIAAIFLATRSISAAVVYDSLEEWGGGYGVRDSEAGQTVQLSGSAREVTQIELSLGANSNAEFRVRFYRLDGIGGTSGTLFWESPTQVFPWDSPYFNRKFIAINVPEVTVPDRFAWVVKGLDTESSVLVRNSPLPTIGTHSDFWIRTSQDNWFSFRLNEGIFGARITAIPEPATILLVALVALLALPSRCRRD